jgi:hypothetical protein
VISSTSTPKILFLSSPGNNLLTCKSYRGIEMASPYKAVFLLPRRSEKKLGEAGWEYSSSERLPHALLLSLVKDLDLRKEDSYLGMDVYEGTGLKLTAVTDERGIEHIYVQIWSRPREDVVRSVTPDDVEVFAPGG